MWIILPMATKTQVYIKYYFSKFKVKALIINLWNVTTIQTSTNKPMIHKTVIADTESSSTLVQLTHEEICISLPLLNVNF